MTNDSNSGNENRFTIDEKMLGYIGEFVLDNGVRIRELSDVVRLLNELNNENTHIKHTIQVAYETERTQIGKNVLKQLMEQIQ